jgi:hypothetical protein
MQKASYRTKKLYTQNMSDCLNLEDVTGTVVQKVGKQLQTYAAKQPRRAETSAQNVKHYTRLQKKNLFFCGKNQNSWVLLISLC